MTKPPLSPDQQQSLFEATDRYANYEESGDQAKMDEAMNEIRSILNVPPETTVGDVLAMLGRKEP